MEERTEIFRFAAGGFRDFTRIASSDPTMWHDVCLANRDAILTMLMHFRDDLDRLTAAVRHQDGEYIRAVFTRAKAARDRFAGIEEAGPPSPGEPARGMARPFSRLVARALRGGADVIGDAPRTYRVAPGGRLVGRVRVPGDKSISHRAVMLGSIADGVTRVEGFSRARTASRP